MEYIVQTKPAKKVIGIELRTSISEAATTIPPHWNRFHSEGLLETIPHRLNDNILGLYIDYEGDYTKPYTLLAGCEVETLEDIPEGMVGKVVPASKYAVYTARGTFPDSLIETWQEIWQSDLKRSYTGDFEVYRDPSNAEVDVYIAVE